MKKLKSIFIVCAIFTLCSCRTTIPEHDTRRPTFNFNIQGLGLNEDINDNFNFDNKVIYLKRGETYKIVYSAGDKGGVQAILWELPDAPAIEFLDTSYPMGWNGIQVSGNKFQVFWHGNRTSPVTGSAIARDIKVNGYTSSTVEELQFFFAINDFHDNEVRKGLVIRIHNGAAYIGDR